MLILGLYFRFINLEILGVGLVSVLISFVEDFGVYLNLRIIDII